MDKSKLLVIDGGAVKTGEDGVVSGMAIVFGSPMEPDRSKLRDFFTKDTYVRKRESFNVPLYYNHGLGPIREEVGEATLTKTVDGWQTTAKLDLSTEAGQQVYEFVKDTPHGFSTGALSHLVKRIPNPNDTNFLSRWVVGELSLTERPAERKAIVYSVKSVDGETVYEQEFEEDLKGVGGSTIPSLAGRDVKTMNELNIEIYDADGAPIWNNSNDVKTLESLETAKTIEIKDVNGSVTYSLYITDDDPDESRGASISVFEWGGVDGFIGHLQEVIGIAAQAVAQDTNEDANEDTTESAVLDSIAAAKSDELETRVERIVKTIIEKDEASQLKTQLEEATQKLADAEAKISDSENALTKANEDIARLEILAGAKKTIDNYKR